MEGAAAAAFGERSIFSRVASLEVSLVIQAWKMLKMFWVDQ
jgi:hypothetical protein